MQSVVVRDPGSIAWRTRIGSERQQDAALCGTYPTNVSRRSEKGKRQAL
jgi:hypothetical protein